MIRITVELVSAQDGTTSRLGDALIMNTGKGTRSDGNYQAVFRLLRKKPWRTSSVKHFPHQTHNVWYLIAEALNAALGAENAESRGGR